MTHAIKWFEIPVTDLDRATRFYEEILNTNLHRLDINEDLKMALLPAAADGIGGALVQNKSFYKPGTQGSLIYLNADPDLEDVLNRVRKKKGKIIQDKKLVSEEVGYMALIEDSEGNRIGLMSAK